VLKYVPYLLSKLRGEGLREYCDASPERRNNKRNEIKRDLIFLCLITRPQEVNDGIESSYLCEVIEEVDERSVDNIFSSGDLFLDFVIVNLVLILNIVFLKIYLVEGIICHCILEWHGLLIIEDVVLDATVTASENFLQHVTDLIDTLQYRNIFIDEEKI
jgi:hypothetical protein